MGYHHRRSRAHACHAACVEMRGTRGATWEIGHVRIMRTDKARDTQAYVREVMTACPLERDMVWELTVSLTMLVGNIQAIVPTQEGTRLQSAAVGVVPSKTCLRGF